MPNLCPRMSAALDDEGEYPRASASTKTGNSHATCRGTIRLLHLARSSSAAKARFRLVTSISTGASSALPGADSAHGDDDCSTAELEASRASQVAGCCKHQSSNGCGSPEVSRGRSGLTVKSL